MYLAHNKLELALINLGEGNKSRTTPINPAVTKPVLKDSRSASRVLDLLTSKLRKYP